MVAKSRLWVIEMYGGEPKGGELLVASVASDTYLTRLRSTLVIPWISGDWLLLDKEACTVEDK